MSHNKPIVFFDGSCPICEKEIRHYKSIDHRQKLQWIDISIETPLLNRHGVSYDDAMRKLHVVNTHCEIKMGIDGFIVIWQQRPKYCFLAKFIETSHLTKTLRFFYGIFAQWRYRQSQQRSLCGSRYNVK